MSSYPGCTVTDCYDFLADMSTCTKGSLDFTTNPEQLKCLCTDTILGHYRTCYPCVIQAPKTPNVTDPPTIETMTNYCKAVGGNGGYGGNVPTISFGGGNMPTPTGNPNNRGNNSGNQTGDGKSNTGLYIGIGAGVAVVLLGIAAFFIMRQRRKKSQTDPKTQAATAAAAAAGTAGGLPPAPPMTYVQSHQQPHQPALPTHQEYTQHQSAPPVHQEYAQHQSAPPVHQEYAQHQPVYGQPSPYGQQQPAYMQAPPQQQHPIYEAQHITAASAAPIAATMQPVSYYPQPTFPDHTMYSSSATTHSQHPNPSPNMIHMDPATGSVASPATTSDAGYSIGSGGIASVSLAQSPSTTGAAGAVSAAALSPMPMPSQSHTGYYDDSSPNQQYHVFVPTPVLPQDAMSKPATVHGPQLVPENQQQHFKAPQNPQYTG